MVEESRRYLESHRRTVMGDDDWSTEVTKLLLTEFGGRAKFGELETRLYQRNLVGGGTSRLLRNLSNCNRLSIFKQSEGVKHVSVRWDHVSICCGFRRRGQDTCKRYNCNKFHVCKFFISGNCEKGSRCVFGHDLQNEANLEVSHRLNLSSFSPEQIRIIIFRSHPAVCVKYNTGGCDDDDCPDLHVCSLFILKKCTAGCSCLFEHSLKASVHNQWVLNAFGVGHLEDVVLRNRILVTIPSKTEINADPSRYEYICETYTWTGVCPNGANCRHYHNPERLPYLWLIGGEGQWSKSLDSVALERRYCDPGDFTLKFPGDFIDFNTLSSIGANLSSSLKRLSTPSYVTSAPGTPLNFYTQWVWYRQERDGTYSPFYPGGLQYTLEEKYLNNQDKYYFEFEDLRLMVDMGSMKQINQDTKRFTKLLRRPVFVPKENSKILEMSPLLLHDVAKHVHQVPDNWSVVDRFQDFELVELESDNSDYCAVHRQFFLTMDVTKHNIVNIFRVQNPGLWDKYCSAKRAMTPKDQVQKGVDERQLFHGTPTLQAARGICANSFDFRRSGENVGAVLGKGAYFSTLAKYSHKFTGVHTPAKGDPTRFMFLGRILVGQYTLGHSSYTKPPERDRLKMYDSCVNNMSNPTIFVIFDLTQSYPEYLIQYTDVSDSRQEAQCLQHISQPQQIPPAIDASVSLIPRSSLLSLKSTDTSLALPSTPRHRSTASTAASTSTTTSTPASRVRAGGLSIVSPALSHLAAKQSVSHAEPERFSSARILPASTPSAASTPRKETNTKLLLSAVKHVPLARRPMHQQLHSANQPCASSLTQPVPRSATVQPDPHSALLPSASAAGQVSQSALSQLPLRVEAAAAKTGQVKSTLSQRVSRSATPKPVLLPVKQPSTFAPAPTSATAQPEILEANIPSASASPSVGLLYHDIMAINKMCNDKLLEEMVAAVRNEMEFGPNFDDDWWP